MPTYEYECGRCAHTFERFQSMTEEPAKRCPKCRGKVRRMIGTGAGLIFKGSGFYITDYRTDSYQKASKADQSAGTEAGGKTEAKPKPETTPAKTEKPKTAATAAPAKT